MGQQECGMEKLDRSPPAAKQKMLASPTNSTTSRFSKRTTTVVTNADRTLTWAHPSVANVVTVTIVTSCSTLWMSLVGVKCCFNQASKLASYHVIRRTQDFLS